MGSRCALIGLDWGTTAFRAYRLDAQGAVLEAKSAAAGILKVPAGDFEQVFEREVGPWLADDPDLPVIAAGMITSRQGWVEVPYCPCPAGCAEIAAALLRHATSAGRRLRFVPGLSIAGADGVPDVIRGEETQIIGAVGGAVGGALDGEDGAAPGPRLLVLPGTHSKWALVEDGRLVWFATFMTGELFAVLKEHSILGRLIAGEQDDADAFRRGLAYARASRGGLLKRLFSARTLGLFGALPETGIASYLSGLLIGSELREALECLERGPADQKITVVGSSDLSGRYLAAIQHAGLFPDAAGRWAHAGRGLPVDTPGLDQVRVVPAVTGACLLLRRELFERLGGLDERLPVTYSDVDLCRRASRLGLRNVVTPHARLLHYEGLSRGFSTDAPGADHLRAPARYAQLALDPAHHGDDQVRSADHGCGRGGALRRAAQYHQVTRLARLQVRAALSGFCCKRFALCCGRFAERSIHAFE